MASSAVKTEVVGIIEVSDQEEERERGPESAPGVRGVLSDDVTLTVSLEENSNIEILTQILLVRGILATTLA